MCHPDNLLVTSQPVFPAPTLPFITNATPHLSISITHTHSYKENTPIPNSLYKLHQDHLRGAGSMDGSFEGPPPPPRAPSRRGHLRHRTKSSDTFPDPISNPWPISTAESQGDRRLLPSYGDPSFGLIYPFFSKSQIEASKRNPKKPPNEEMTERQEGQQDGESSPQPSSSTAQQPFELRQSLPSPERSSNTSYGQVPTVSVSLAPRQLATPRG